MTPSRFEPASVQAELRLLTELIDDLDVLGEVDEGRLRRERRALRALERLVTRVVEVASSAAGHIAASRLPVVASTYRGSFSDIHRLGVIDEELAVSLGVAAGMRDLLVNDCARVDLGLVAAAVPRLRGDAAAFVRQVSSRLAGQGRP